MVLLRVKAALQWDKRVVNYALIAGKDGGKRERGRWEEGEGGDNLLAT